MKAMVYRRYGAPNVIQLGAMPKPTPKDNEVLIRIHASTVSTADWRARSLSMPGGFGPLARPVFGLFGPRQPVLGTDISGEIEAVGRAVTGFKPGDQVIAFPGGAYGSHAEYRTMKADGPIALKPANLNHEQAVALLFGGTTALPLLRDNAKIKPGDKVLVVGASGAVGSAAVQIARALGAAVTGVASARNLDLVRAIGAQRAIDYQTTDFAAEGELYDVIFDTTGSAPFARSGRALKPGGQLVVVLGSLRVLLGLDRPAKGSGKRVIATVATTTAEHLRTLVQLAEQGALKPVIDRNYTLEDAAEAHAYVDTGRKRGSVVLTIRQ